MAENAAQEAITGDESNSIAGQDIVTEYGNAPEGENRDALKVISSYRDAGYNLGDKNSTDSIDCSGFVDSVFSALGVDVSPSDKSSDGIWRNSNNKKEYTDWEKIPETDLKLGTIIAFDTGEHGFDEKRATGIDHIGMIVQDSSGNTMIAESSDSKGGVTLTPYKERMAELDSSLVKVFIGDYALEEPAKAPAVRKDNSDVIFEYEKEHGSVVGSGLKNYGFTDKKYYDSKKPGYKSKYKQMFENGLSKKDAKTLFKEEYESKVPKGVPDPVKDRLADWNFNTGRSVEDLLMFTAGLISLDDIQTKPSFKKRWDINKDAIISMTKSPGFAAKLDKKKHEVMKDFWDRKVKAKQAEIAAFTNPATSGGRGYEGKVVQLYDELKVLKEAYEKTSKGRIDMWKNNNR